MTRDRQPEGSVGQAEAGEGSGRMGTRAVAVAVAAIVGLLVIGPARLALAEHESTNVLVFAPTVGSASPLAAGDGVIAYKGGAEPGSRWTITLRLSGLEPGQTYAVVVRGRTGDDGSAEAMAFSSLCRLRASAAGEGGCWDYAQGMRRLGVVQVRVGDERGTPVLQATRAPGGPGAVTSLPNEHSPSPAASPVAATPAPR